MMQPESAMHPLSTRGPTSANGPNDIHILTINAGSSSIKSALYVGAPLQLALKGQMQRIGTPDAEWTISSADGAPLGRQRINTSDHDAALASFLNILQQHIPGGRFDAVGHRVVHGGPKYRESQRITPELLDELRRISPFDPEHLPSEIRLIDLFRDRQPGLLQVACFDTAFHRNMPRVAQLLPIPRRYQAGGIVRYGFHGLSYSYLMEELARQAGEQAASGRIILAHLGSGASLAAVYERHSLDTTMGFTPTAGLMMSTRSGDLDPGIVAFLARSEGMNADQFSDMVNSQSGLLGVSETSADMRDLLARSDDPRAVEAVDLFCYVARKWIGAYAAVLGGLDTLVFSAGIGEHSPPVRSGICKGLEFLGVRLDEVRNRQNAAIISTDSSKVTVRVIPTDEEQMIARDVNRILNPATAGT